MMEDMMALHRSKLETDRQALRQINRTRSPIVPSRESLEAQKNAPQPKRRVAPRSPPYTGLKLGGYEKHQKNLKAQANLEYNAYLEKQKPRSGLQASPLIAAEKKISKQVSPRKDEDKEKEELPQTEQNLDETYQKLLERKREIERKYRAQTGDFPSTPTAKENVSDSQRKVHFEKDDDLSRAVKRLEALSTYDKELEDWNAMRSGALGRGIQSAREERVEAPLTQQDRSKSVPHSDSPSTRQMSTVSFLNVGGTGTTPEERKKKYAEDLRRQMDEQRKAKLKEREEYHASPSQKKKNAPDKFLTKQSPLERAEESVRQRLNTKFEKLSPEPAVARPARIPASPTRESPGRLPQYPPGGYFPPPGYNMYPPYMYPPYMMPPPVMQPGMMPQMGGMMQQPMVNGAMPPQMMNGAHQPANNPQYDPYQIPQYYGLERRRSGESRERRSRERPPEKPRTPSKPRNIETIESPAITRITDIGANSDTPKAYKGMLDPVEYARELKRQVEEREKEKNKKKEEQEKYDRKKEEECANYNPWGRGGAGAPLKDAQGQAVANRNQMKQNAQDPIALQKEQQSRVVAPPPVEDTPTKTEGNGSHFGRVNQITGTPQEDDPVKVAAKQDYKSFLQQQIEERAKLKAEQKEKERLEDEREAQRLERERLRLKAEFEAELQAKKEKEAAQQKMNEELKRAAEDRRIEQERREAEARKKLEEEARRKKEEEQRQAEQLEQRMMRPPAVDQRGRSPPIPTLANQKDGSSNINRESIVIPTHANKQDQPPDIPRESIVIPTHADRQQEPARESIVIPTHANRQSPLVPKLDLAGRVETDAGGDLRPSDRRPPSILGPSRSNGGTPKSGDVTKDHVMTQLSALRTQLNRLQNVKSNQNQLGKPVKIADTFDTELDRAAKRRNPAAPARTDYDNLSLLSQDLRDRYELFSGHDELGDKFRNIQLQDRDSLDGQCSSEFVACTPEPTQLVQGSTQNNRYKRPPSNKRPPSGTSIQSFDVHKIAQRNEERLRRLENMQSDRIFKEQSPDLILDAFLSDNRPESEASLDCETSYKPAF